MPDFAALFALPERFIRRLIEREDLRRYLAHVEQRDTEIMAKRPRWHATVVWSRKPPTKP